MPMAVAVATAGPDSVVRDDERALGETFPHVAQLRGKCFSKQIVCRRAVDGRMIEGVVAGFLIAFPALFSMVNPPGGALIYSQVTTDRDLPSGCGWRGGWRSIRPR